MTARRSTRRPPLAAVRGNTLIEVLVSVLIFSFGLLGLVGMQAKASQYSVDAEDRNRAALLADDLAAQMRLARSVTLSADALAAWKTRLQTPALAGLPNADYTLTINGTAADLVITWKPPRAPAAAASSQLSTQVVLTAEETGP